MILGAEIQIFLYGHRVFKTILCLFICLLYVFYIGINFGLPLLLPDLRSQWIPFHQFRHLHNLRVLFLSGSLMSLQERRCSFCLSLA